MVFGVSLGHWHAVHGTAPDDVKRLFGELSDMGIGGVKVECPDADDADWKTYARMIAEYAVEFDFQVSAHAPGGDISSTDESFRSEGVEKIAAAIQAVGSEIPGILFAVHPEDYLPVRVPGDDEARMERCYTSLETLAETASAVGARIALENMRSRPDNPNRTGMYTHQLERIITGLDPVTVGICIDTGHANISEDVTVAEAFTQVADRVIHVHYDDNLGVDDQHLPPGEGNVDFAAFFRAANDAGYDGMIELEVKVRGDDPLAFWKKSYEYYLEMGGQAR
jgi:sugar phosphate isomerase/epimerase